MAIQENQWAEVDAEGRLVLSKELAAKIGLTPGAKVRLEASDTSIRMHHPVTHLAKLYIEPTDMCNLDCDMCLRHTWEANMGRMSQEIFDAILNSLRLMEQKPVVFFGGIGEPTFHPYTLTWIKAVKETGARVELITNGTTLNEKSSRLLIDSGLDVLWVSIDGSHAESYADLRLGQEHERVVHNLRQFSQMRSGGHKAQPQIGIAFVAMKRNVKDLVDVIKIGKQVRASYFSVSNVMPYTEDMQDEQLYKGLMSNIAYLSSPWLPKISLPKLDMSDAARQMFFDVINSGLSVNYAGNSFSGANDVCNFIENGTMTVAWDGKVSPCWPLMHTHSSYLHGKLHRQRRHVVGDVREKSLTEIWLDSDYLAYRQKVQSFAFAPCTFCGGCDLAESNDEDCIGNEFPACGSCLWSQGVIQCP